MTKPELFTATFNGRTDVLVAKCSQCENKYDIVDSSLAYSSQPISGEEFTDLREVQIAEMGDTVIKGVPREELDKFVTDIMARYLNFSDTKGRDIYFLAERILVQPQEAKGEPSSSGVAVGLDNINFGKAIPQTNPETTEVFTTSVKKKPDVATAAWISHKGWENCVATKVEIELTEYDKRNIRSAMTSIPLPVPLAEIIAKLYYAISPRPVKGEK